MKNDIDIEVVTVLSQFQLVFFKLKEDLENIQKQSIFQNCKFSYLLHLNKHAQVEQIRAESTYWFLCTRLISTYCLIFGVYLVMKFFFELSF